MRHGRDDRLLVVVDVDEKVRVQRVEEATVRRRSEASVDLDRSGETVDVRLDRLRATLELVVSPTEPFFVASTFKSEGDSA